MDIAALYFFNTEYLSIVTRISIRKVHLEACSCNSVGLYLEGALLESWARINLDRI